MPSNEPIATAGGGLVRVRLLIAYDGTDFAGWAVQPGQRTVAGTLTEGLNRVLRSDDLVLTVAGRTDAGVHALGQVAHVDVPRASWDALPGRGDHPANEALVRRLAGVLPPDVVVRGAEVVPAEFDARFSALWRSYRYSLCDAFESRDPLRRLGVTWISQGRLDESAMDAAARLLLGEHDWLGYCKPRDGASTVRTLHEFTWQRIDGLVVGDVRADAFCHHMVRSLVGACVAVGLGRRPMVWPRAVLDARRRDPAVQIMPSQGLVLTGVGYPEPSEYGQQQRATRRLRTLPRPE